MNLNLPEEMKWNYVKPVMVMGMNVGVLNVVKMYWFLPQRRKYKLLFYPPNKNGVNLFTHDENKRKAIKEEFIHQYSLPNDTAEIHVMGFYPHIIIRHEGKHYKKIHNNDFIECNTLFDYLHH